MRTRDTFRAGAPPVKTGGAPVFFKEENAAGFARIAGLERTAGHMIESVSYTHLDVYKRQVPAGLCFLSKEEQK